MANKSINLCGLDGTEAMERLIQKIREPDSPLRIGAISLLKITRIEHHDDGQLVITAEARDEDLLIFQFEPNQNAFSTTALGQDGDLLCTPADHLE